MAEMSVLCQVDARGVARLTLNRPEVFNAYNEELLGELAGACENLGADDAIRVVLLAGKGRHFSAGADVNWFKGLATAFEDSQLAAARATAEAMRALAMLPKPTIGLVHNACFGGGCGFAASCDILIASEDARFSISEVRLGLTPAPILPQLVAAMGARALRRYALDGETFDAGEARRRGLVHEICPVGGLEDAVAPMVDALLLGGPRAISETKRLITDVAGTGIDEALAERMARDGAQSRATAEGREGVSAFLDKRKPQWATDDEGP